MKISEAVRLSGISAFTLRFYDKQGLLPFVRRSRAGTRIFTKSDFPLIILIGALRSCGVPIREIRRFVEAAVAGEDTLDQRLGFLLHQHNRIAASLAVVEEHMRETRAALRRSHAAEKPLAGTEAAVLMQPDPTANPASRNALLHQPEKKTCAL